MRFGRLTTYILGAFLLSIFPLDTYAQQSINGHCNVQIVGSHNPVRVTCYPVSGPPTTPPTPVDPQDPESVILSGGWWANFHKSSRSNNFGQLVGAYQLPNQVLNGNEIGMNWGRNSRPNPFPQGPGVTFSAKLFGQRYFERGMYCFQIETRKGRDFTRVYLGNALILSHWYPSPGGDSQGCYILEAGIYPIRVEYMTTGGAANLGVSWYKRSQLSQAVELVH